MKKKEISIKESWYIFAITILIIALIVMIGFFLKNPFAVNLPASNGIVPIGTPQIIEVNDNGSESIDLFFYGSVLPSSKVVQDVNVTLKADQNSCRARGKGYMFDSFGKVVSLELITSNIWENGGDGYYYLTETLEPGLTLDFVEKIIMPNKSVNLNSTNIYTIIISIETLPFDSDYQNIWGFNND